MRVRKKLIVLHTFFSLVLAGVLAAAMWPAITRILEEAELHEAKLALSVARSRVAAARVAAGPGADADEVALRAMESVRTDLPIGVRIARGGLDEFGWPTALGQFSDAVMVEGEGSGRLANGTIAAWSVDPDDQRGYVATARLEAARRAVAGLYVIVTAALLVVYGLIAAALELFVLPRHVYQPIRAILRADRAIQEGRADEALVPEGVMPADELGEIMRSRNRSILALRAHERDLAKALADLASAAADLKRKNHLLETARRNLADAGRLASLGMMSAGLAHEINTPLAVAKGLIEKMNASPDKRLSESEAALLLRVAGRLERLSESLLDFARVRPPVTRPAPVAALLDEAWELVRLDRQARRVELVRRVPGDVVIECDPDRMVQVLVNLLRNAVDAIDSPRRGGGGGGGSGGGDAEREQTPPPAPLSSSSHAGPRGTITVDAAAARREGRGWVTLTIADDGPGIDPEILSRLFEPFASTRLDSHGTGLGLAVSEGIVREHGGVLLARNRADGRGSVFEIVLPEVAIATTLQA